jgi:hypothetical protein
MRLYQLTFTQRSGEGARQGYVFKRMLSNLIRWALIVLLWGFVILCAVFIARGIVPITGAD